MLLQLHKGKCITCKKEFDTTGLPPMIAFQSFEYPEGETTVPIHIEARFCKKCIRKIKDSVIPFPSQKT